MNKDAYYFPHFSNARTDRKLRRVRKELGIEGYAIYFMTLEVLREQEDFAYPISDIDLLADDFGTSEAKVEAIVKGYGLFKIDDDEFFFSPKLIEYLKPYLERSKRARKAALKRWRGDTNANALPEHSDSNASKVKESKEKQSKVNQIKENERLPTLSQSISYFSEISSNDAEANKFYNYYSAKGWLIGGENVHDWKALARNWVLRDKNAGREFTYNEMLNECHKNGMSTDNFKMIEKDKWVKK